MYIVFTLFYCIWEKPARGKSVDPDKITQNVASEWGQQFATHPTIFRDMNR